MAEVASNPPAARGPIDEFDYILLTKPELNLALSMLGVKDKVRYFVGKVIPLLLATPEGREVLEELGYPLVRVVSDDLNPQGEHGG